MEVYTRDPAIFYRDILISKEHASTESFMMYDEDYDESIIGRSPQPTSTTGDEESATTEVYCDEERAIAPVRNTTTPPKGYVDLDRSHIIHGDNDENTVLHNNLSSSSFSSLSSFDSDRLNKKKKKKRFTIFLLSLLFFLVIVIGVGAGLGIAKNNERRQDGDYSDNHASPRNSMKTMSMADCLELEQLELEPENPIQKWECEKLLASTKILVEISQSSEDSDFSTASRDEDEDVGEEEEAAVTTLLDDSRDDEDGSNPKPISSASSDIADDADVSTTTTASRDEDEDAEEEESTVTTVLDDSRDDEDGSTPKPISSASPDIADDADVSTTTTASRNDDEEEETAVTTVLDDSRDDEDGSTPKPISSSSPDIADDADASTTTAASTEPVVVSTVPASPTAAEELAFAKQEEQSSEEERQPSAEEVVVFRSPTKEPTDVPWDDPNDSEETWTLVVYETGKTTDEPTTHPIDRTPAVVTETISDYYKYTNSTSKCTGGNVIQQTNINGPQPLSDKTNVAIQFFAFGDTPYDPYSNTCIDANGEKEEDCTSWDCTASTSNLPADNTCTFEGSEYECVRDSILPYMNGRMEEGDAAFVAHTGDFIRGSGPASNTRCTSYSFESRKKLFGNYGTNFLPVPGDNDWNECYGYDINSNTDPMRELWRDNFAAESSPFHQFTRDFPQGGVGGGCDGGSRPTIHRQDSNPENYFFSHNNVAFFGINRPDGRSYISNKAPLDTNEAWVEHRLGLDSSSESSSCTFQSIVIIGHTWPKESLYDKVEEYFDACGGTVLPVLSVSGNAHPRSYCMTSKGESNMRVEVTVEAFQSGPLLISVVRDPDSGGDFFHVEDVDPVDSNRQCPTFP